VGQFAQFQVFPHNIVGVLTIFLVTAGVRIITSPRPHHQEAFSSLKAEGGRGHSSVLGRDEIEESRREERGRFLNKPRGGKVTVVAEERTN